MPIEHISAVTLAVRDMAVSLAFYQKCGFSLLYGGPEAEFTSLKAGQGFVNLIRTPAHRPAWWGRAIFRVKSADRQHERMLAAGLSPDGPTDAPWGERFFHIIDPDGHELSFAEQLAPASIK